MKVTEGAVPLDFQSESNGCFAEVFHSEAFAEFALKIFDMGDTGSGD